MTRQRQSEHPWKVPIAVTEIPDSGKRIEVIADAATRTAVASLAGVAGVPRLEAHFDLTRHGHESVRVVGRVAATVEQNCVVTLEPMQTQIDEVVDLVFTASPRETAESRTAEQIHALDDCEPPQPLENGTVDLGALASEFLLLGIDPYPRRGDAVLDVPSPREVEARPFAALAALKKDLGGKSS